MRGKSRKFRLIVAVLLLTMAVPASAAMPERLVPVGQTVGIRMETGYLTVVGLVGVDGSGGGASPAGDAGLLPGDRLLRLGAESVDSAESFRAAAEGLNGSPVTLTVRRGERTLQYTVQPAQSSGGNWQLGLWLRDGIEGVGTVTWYDPDTGTFGALGHGICREESGALLDMARGELCPATVFQVVRGEIGRPGMLCGSFDRETPLGEILANTVCGIFGRGSQTLNMGESVSLAGLEQVETGPAEILACVGEETCRYAVELTAIHRGGGSRCFQLKVTDPALLSATGGVVQGMSGSPILQNGRLIGAVTHVLVSDPTRGFGIGIETMLEAAGYGDADAA